MKDEELREAVGFLKKVSKNNTDNFSFFAYCTKCKTVHFFTKNTNISEHETLFTKE